MYVVHLCQARVIVSPSVYLNLLSLCVAAHDINALIQWSLILHWQAFSLVCFSMQLLIHFPHWYSVAERGMKEGFPLGADINAHVACRLLRVDERPHIRECRLGESGEAAWGFNDALLPHDSRTAAECQLW